MTRQENARSGLVLRRGSPPLFLALVTAAVFFGTLDQTVVVTILPNIIDSLGLPVSKFGQATWIVNGYLLGYAIALPIVGALADMYGHLRLYLICLAIFVAGSAAVAMAPNIPLLVAGRSFQAIGGGGVLPVAIAIAADVLPVSRRPLAFGSLAAVNNASSLLGPIWGAALVGFVGWRGVFWLNVLLVVPLGVALAWSASETSPHRARALDVPGVSLLVLGLAAGTVALTDDGANPRSFALSLFLGLLSLTALALFVWRELHCAQPLVRLRSFGQARFLAAMSMYFLIGGALIVALVDIPLMRNVLAHGTAVQGGLDLMRLLLLLPIGGLAGGLLCTRAGYRLTAILGLVIAIAGFLLMRTWPNGPSSVQLWLALGAVGFGLGLCDAPIISAVLNTALASERAMASALLLVLWTCGMIVGLGLLGTQGLSSFSTRAARLFREQGTNLDVSAIDRLLHQTFSATFVGAAAALAVALLLAFLLPSGRPASVRWTPMAALDE